MRHQNRSLGAGGKVFPLPRPVGLARRDLLSLSDLSVSEVEFFLQLGLHVKAHASLYRDVLADKTLVLILEKPSLRTRVTFEVGMGQLGGHAVFLGPQEIGLGKREAVKDVARNLSRWVDAIVARVFSHSTLAELADYASVPVINALSDFEHPCQALGDYLTLLDHCGKLSGISLAWVGDGNNVLHSLLYGAARLGARMRIATPIGYEPALEVVAAVRRESGDVLLTHDPAEAVSGADVVYTDVWTSMGQEEEAEIRQKVFPPYQVNRELMSLASPKALFMHCLPAHRGQEVTDEVIDSPCSIVFDQAENRLHIEKAILLALLA